MERCSRMRSRSRKLRGAQGSTLDADAVPKCDAVLDFSGCGLRLGVVPSSVVVLHAVDCNMEIVGSALPRTDRSVIAGLEEFLIDTFRREILVAFDDDSGAAFRDDFSAPGCFGHFVPLRRRTIALHRAAAGHTNSPYRLDARAAESAQKFVRTEKDLRIATEDSAQSESWKMATG